MRATLTSILLTSFLFTASVATAQRPPRPSEVRDPLERPGPKRSPGPMLDANNKDKASDEEAPKAVVTKAPAPERAASAEDEEHPASLEAARARVEARTTNPDRANGLRSIHRKRLQKMLKKGIPPEVKAALEKHARRMAKLERIETLALEANDAALVARTERAMGRAALVLSAWLANYEDEQRSKR